MWCIPTFRPISLSPYALSDDFSETYCPLVVVAFRLINVQKLSYCLIPRTKVSLTRASSGAILHNRTKNTSFDVLKIAAMDEFSGFRWLENFRETSESF